MLLEALLDISRTLLASKKLLCVYFDVQDHADVLPVEAVHAHLKEEEPDAPIPEEPWQTLAQLNKWLKQQSRQLFLVIDELQFAFTAHCHKKGRDIIQQVGGIGACRSGLIHCVLSGSSSVLRQLCFDKLSDTLADSKTYPNFVRGYDLNSTKYSARWIYPFLDVADFTTVLQRAQELYEVHPSFSSEEMTQIYLHTGGYGRALTDAAQQRQIPHISSYSTTLRSQVPPEQLRILQKLYEWISTRVIAHSLQQEPENVGQLYSVEGVAAFMQLVPANIAVQLPQDTNDMYRLADAGLLRLDENHSFIGFGSPAIVVALATHADAVQKLSMTQIFAMLNPVGDVLGKVAEEVALQCLARGAHRLLGLPGELHPITFELVLSEPNEAADASTAVLQWPGGVSQFASPPPASPSASASASASAAPVPVPSPCPIVQVQSRLSFFFPSVPVVELARYVWKESYKKSGKDVLGADAVIFQQSGASIIAHRIQIKLGPGASSVKKQLDLATKIINRFGAMRKETEDAYSIRPDINFTLRNCLLSTQQMAPEVLTKLKNAGIHVFSAHDLQAHVWPQEIKNLGRPYC